MREAATHEAAIYEVAMNATIDEAATHFHTSEPDSDQSVGLEMVKLEMSSSPAGTLLARDNGCLPLVRRTILVIVEVCNMKRSAPAHPVCILVILLLVMNVSTTPARSPLARQEANCNKKGLAGWVKKCLIPSSSQHPKPLCSYPSLSYQNCRKLLSSA